MQGSSHTAGISDTIAALSTPAGVGGVGVIRLSGPRAADILTQCFRPAGGGKLEDHPPRQMVYGRLLDREGQTIDRCLAFYTAGTASFTGEITGELHCHGSPMVLSLALETLFALGCRQAGPGEFTRRAFCSGKLDLAQSEAVADLLEARSRESVRHAAGRLGGALSRRIEEIYQALTQLDAHFCAVLDYPDEDLDPFTANTLKTALEGQRQALGGLTDSWRRGRQISQGVPCALVGRPNGGKSSLFNALVGYDRAIVTPIPGTTRDTVEERLELGGVPLRLIDTAGLRQAQDPIEQLGVERSQAAMEGAGLVLVLADGGKPLAEEDRDLLAQAKKKTPSPAGPDQSGSGAGGVAGRGGRDPERQDGPGAGGPGGGGGPVLSQGGAGGLWRAAVQRPAGGGRGAGPGTRGAGPEGPGGGVRPGRGVKRRGAGPGGPGGADGQDRAGGRDRLHF